MFVCICVATTTTLNCCDMLRVGGPDDIFYLFNRFVFAAFTCDQRFIYDGVLLGLQQPIPNPYVMFTMWSVFIYFGNSRKYHAFAWIVSFAWSIMGVLIPQFFIPNLYKQIYKSAGKKILFLIVFNNSVWLCGCVCGGWSNPVVWICGIIGGYCGICTDLKRCIDGQQICTYTPNEDYDLIFFYCLLA